MIWEHASPISDPRQLRSALRTSVCLFCESGLNVVSHEDDGFSMHGNGESVTIEACSICGWWRGAFHAWADWSDLRYDTLHAAAAVLRQFDETGVTEPLEDIRQYLLARYHKRHDLAPRVLEQIVASVYANLGYTTVATGHSGDGGIDGVFEDSHGSLTGVQVKRYKNSIEVEHIRALVGALILKGMTRGMFITTSRFQAGASDAVTLAAMRGLRIELVDADRFFDALKIAHRPMYKTRLDFPSLRWIELHSFRGNRRDVPTIA